MIFLRIYDNVAYNIGDVDKLGFPKSDPSFIPDDYLYRKEFVVMRSCFGIGDWGIITAMPRLLKRKYPDCKVYIPSVSLLESLFGKRGLFDTTYEDVLSLFENNPYIDGNVMKVEGDIFHDHYRIYDDLDTNVPILEQMLDFWQFSEDERLDSMPELYWSDAEKKLGDEIIRTYIGQETYGALLLSNRFGTQFGKHDEIATINDTEKISKLLNEHTYPYIYWTYKPLNETPFDFIDGILDMHNMPLRIQLYLKSKARVNIANQCGTNHLVVRYSKVYEVKRQKILSGNFVRGITYL